MSEKLCRKCNKVKPIDCYSKDSRAKDGKQSACKDCNKKYWSKNKEHYSEIRKNNELIKDSQRKYFLENKDKINEYRRSRYNTEEGRAKVKVNNRNRRDKIRATSDGSITYSRILELLKEQDYKCAISGVDIRDNYHIDHIIPLAKGGEHKDFNIQLLAPSVNMSKKDRIL